MVSITRKVTCIALSIFLAFSMIPVASSDSKAWADSSPTVDLAATTTIQLSNSVKSGPHSLQKWASLKYNFTLASASRVVFTFMQSASAATDNSLHAELSNNYGNTIHSWDIHGSIKAPISIGDFVLGKGTYSLVFTANMPVSGIYIQGSWADIKNMLGGTSESSFDIESEPNTSRETANQLKPGRNFVGSFYDPSNEEYVPNLSTSPLLVTDIDFLTFNVDAESTSSIALDIKGSVIFGLYDSGGNSLKDVSLKSGTNNINLGTLAEGDYFISLVSMDTNKISWGKEYIAKLTLTPKPLTKITPILNVQDIQLTHNLSQKDYFNNPVRYNGDGKLAYKSSNSSVVYVYNDGDMLAKKAGSAIITVTASEGSKYKGASTSFKVVVVDDTSESSTPDSTPAESTSGTGKITPLLVAQMPVMSMKTTDTGFFKNHIIYNGNGRLTYTTSNRNVVSVYSDGNMLPWNAGTAIITVTASETSSYYAVVTTFKVVVTKPSSGFRMSRSKIVVAWSGSFRNKFVNASGGTITQSSSNKKVATINSNGNVTYKGIGESLMSATQAETGYYSKDTAHWTLQIVPDSTNIWFADPLKNGFRVKWSKQAKRFCTGYQIRYSTSRSMKGSQVKTVKGANKQTAKIGKLKGGKRYYVQVRVYKTVSGKNYCSAWSKKTAVKTK